MWAFRSPLQPSEGFCNTETEKNRWIRVNYRALTVRPIFQTSSSQLHNTDTAQSQCTAALCSICGCNAAHACSENSLIMWSCSENQVSCLDSPSSETDGVLMQRPLEAEQRPPLQVESATQFILQPPPQRACPPLPLFPFPPLPSPRFLLLFARHFIHAVFVCLRLVGLLWQVGALLLLQPEADGEVLGASGGFGVQGAAGGAEVDSQAAPRHPDSGVAAAPASPCGPHGEVTDLCRVDFVQKRLQE